jgi:hypothetical protein
MLHRLRARMRYRRMQRLLRQLDRADARERRGSGPRRDTSSFRGPALFVAGLALVIAALVAVRVWFPEFALGNHRPPPEVVRGPGGTGPYAFMNTLESGGPVTYSSCEPIRYVINPAGMPAEIPPLIQQAVQQVGSASGLGFSYDGTSAEPPSAERAARQPERYSGHWAPVLIAWADQPPAADAPKDGSETFGSGGSTYVAEGGARGSTRYVTGRVTLYGHALTPLLRGDNGPARVRAVITHELGHVLGLGHTDDPNSLMTPSYTGRTELGPGDLEGLRRLGRGPCIPDR